jgi:hypothetical protein
MRCEHEQRASVRPLDQGALPPWRRRRRQGTHTGGGEHPHVDRGFGAPASHGHTWVGGDTSPPAPFISLPLRLVWWPRVANLFARCCCWRSWPWPARPSERAYVCGSVWRGGVQLPSHGGAGTPTQLLRRLSYVYIPTNVLILLLLLRPHVRDCATDIFSQRIHRSRRVSYTNKR